jgi:hypothetical protein
MRLAAVFGGLSRPACAPNQEWCMVPERVSFPTKANSSRGGDAKPRVRDGLTAGLPKEGSCRVVAPREQGTS